MLAIAWALEVEVCVTSSVILSSAVFLGKHWAVSKCGYYTFHLIILHWNWSCAVSWIQAPQCGQNGCSTRIWFPLHFCASQRKMTIKTETRTQLMSHVPSKPSDTWINYFIYNIPRDSWYENFRYIWGNFDSYILILYIPAYKFIIVTMHENRCPDEKKSVTLVWTVCQEKKKLNKK